MPTQGLFWKIIKSRSWDLYTLYTVSTFSGFLIGSDCVLNKTYPVSISNTLLKSLI